MQEKFNLVGQCTVCLKGKNQHLLKKNLMQRYEGACGVKKKIQKTLILVFEVIVEPPKTHFSTFSKVQKQKNSETKIMKITHSATHIINYLHSPS